MRHGLIVLAVAALVWGALQSSRLQIIHADRNIGRKESGQQLRVLKGNVHVLKDTIHIYCDSAKYYEAVERLDLFGRVKVDDGDKIMRSGKMRYYVNSDVLEAEQRVRIRSKSDSLFAQFVRYNLGTKEARANKDVFMFNYPDSAEITGDQAYYSEKDSVFRASGNARFRKYENSDTFTVKAAHITYLRSGGGSAVAIDSVRITRGSLLALADTARYLSKAEEARLRGNPRAWIDESKLTGKFINAHFDSNEVDYIYVKEEAEAISRVDSVSDNFNRLRGREIEFFIQKRQPVRIVSRHNASSLYFLKETGDQGTSYATADSIFIFFKQGELDSIQVIGGAQGVYYPEGYKGEKKFGE